MPRSTFKKTSTSGPPTDEEARFLRMTPDQRVYEIFHMGLTRDDRPVKVNVYVLPTYQWKLRYRYRADPE
jgi:GntR family transcriptional regulator